MSPTLVRAVLPPPVAPTLICLVLTLTSPPLAPPPARAAQEAGSAERFLLVLGGAAVEDRTTGLVWEQAPDRIFDAWEPSVARCATKRIGGRTGWRAPTIEELRTLIDPSRSDPALPEGHPFSDIRSAIYWAATSHPDNDVVAWQVSFFSGKVQTDQKSLPRRMWCVSEK